MVKYIVHLDDAGSRPEPGGFPPVKPGGITLEPLLAIGDSSHDSLWVFLGLPKDSYHSSLENSAVMIRDKILQLDLQAKWLAEPWLTED